MEVLGMAAGGAAANGAMNVYSYNRTAWIADVRAHQARRYHRHMVLMNQAKMFRDDIREIIYTANQQQHNFILVATLVLGMAVRAHFVTTFPLQTMFLHNLYNLCIGSAVLYLALALVCAIGANHLAVACKKDMLINTVRLPIEDIMAELDENAPDESAEAFEHQSLGRMLRVPGLNRVRHARTGSTPALGMTRSEAEGTTNLATMAKRGQEHKRLFRDREKEWKNISKFAPLFIVWGGNYLFTAYGYYGLAHAEQSAVHFGMIGLWFNSAIVIILEFCSSRYLKENRLAVLLEFAVILATQSGVTAAHYLPERTANYCYCCSYMFHVLWTVFAMDKLHRTVAFLETESGEAEHEQFDEESSGALSSDGSDSPKDYRRSKNSVEKVLHRGADRRAMLNVGMTGIGIVSLMWIAALAAAIYHVAHPGLKDDSSQAVVQGEGKVGSAQLKELANAGAGMVTLALSCHGRRKVVDHLGSTLVGSLPGLHPGLRRLTPAALLVVVDGQGREVGGDVPLSMLAARAGGRLLELAFQQESLTASDEPPRGGGSEARAQ